MTYAAVVHALVDRGLMSCSAMMSREHWPHVVVGGVGAIVVYLVGIVALIGPIAWLVCIGLLLSATMVTGSLSIPCGGWFPFAVLVTSLVAICIVTVNLVLDVCTHGTRTILMAGVEAPTDGDDVVP